MRDYRSPRGWALSERQRHRIKKWALAAGRFGLTVAVSVWLSLWLLERHPEVAGALVSGSWPTFNKPARPSVNRISASHPARLGDSYSRYFEEALPILRADPQVRMIRVEMPGEILKYQQLTPLRSSKAPLRLTAMAPRIPLLAISRHAREFLVKMRLSYIDPDTVPLALLGQTSSAKPHFLREFLLVPDLSSEHLGKFSLFHR